MAAALGLIVLALPGIVKAWDNLDIPAELRRPGVRLVVVEFYADWCKPCKAAVPLWNELHEQYKDRGLRLLVVSVGDGGTCSNPGWQPDKVVCDFDGKLQTAFGADTLPQAFLHSWQGNLLVKNGHFDAVKKAVEAYYRSSPRILVGEPEDQDGKKVRQGGALRETVRTDLRRLAKFEIVASDEELSSLRELRRKGHELNYDDAGRCQQGREVSANSELRVKLMSLGSDRTLLLQLYSVESGCMLASSTAAVSGNDFSDASFAAVSALIENLVGKDSLSGSKTADSHDGSSSESVAKELVEEARIRKQRVDAAWKAVQKAISESTLTGEEKVRILKGFLNEFAKYNPYARDAKKRLDSLSNVAIELTFESKAECDVAFADSPTKYGAVLKILYTIKVPYGSRSAKAFLPPGKYVVWVHCINSEASYYFCSHNRPVEVEGSLTTISFKKEDHAGCACPSLFVLADGKLVTIREVLQKALGPEGRAEEIVRLDARFVDPTRRLVVTICEQDAEFAVIDDIHLELDGRRIDRFVEGLGEARPVPHMIVGRACSSYTFVLPADGTSIKNMFLVIAGWYLPYSHLQ